MRTVEQKQTQEVEQTATISLRPERTVPQAKNTVVPRHSADANRFALDFSAIPVQAKLTIGPAGDAYELEADHFASQVMRMPEPSVQRKCACGGTCKDCAVGQSHHHGAHVQTSAYGGGEGGTHAAPAAVLEVLRSSGRPLDANTREFFEPRMSRDFSAVRVHTDSRAGDSAHEIGANAYTLGSDIVFGHGRYAPHTPTGRTLLAHELVHVAQQRAARPLASRVQRKARSVNPDESVPDEEVVTVRPRSEEDVIQGDFALPLPRPDAVGRVLTPAQVAAAIAFNDRVLTPAGVGVIRELRDVLGISPDPAVVDEAFVNAVVQWQAGQGLTQDGMLGPRTAAPLFREIGAEEAGEGRLVSGPAYTPGGTVAPPVVAGQQSTTFRFRAEFESDPANGIFPSCCELRQFVRWNAAAAALMPGGRPHAGFPAGAAADTWIEDRNATDTLRYGHRSGRLSVPVDGNRYTDSTGRANQGFGHIYRGRDTPGGATGLLAGTTWRFMIQVIDVCKGNRVLGSDFKRINW